MSTSAKELRNAALHLATTQLQARFEHLAQAVTSSGDPNAYIEFVLEYYPTTENIIAEAEKYTKFVDAVE
jgi:hypothetical protein